MATTAADIITAAQARWAHEPGAADEIATATPVIDVHYSTDNVGGRVTVAVAPTVVFPDGETADAADPATFGPIRVFDGRDILTTLRWAARKAYPMPKSGVAIRYFRAGKGEPLAVDPA